MNWVYLFTSVEGRISRRTFWIAAVVLGIVEFIGQFLAHQIEGDKLGIIVDLAFTYPEFTLSVKRANDRNMPTYILAAFYVVAVLINFIMLLGWNGQGGGEGGNGNPVFLFVLTAWGVFAIVLIIELGFRRGTVGPNRFGPDPLAAKP
jgi:uncharacterized membrane protein YhaH (DUF805 family)